MKTKYRCDMKLVDRERELSALDTWWNRVLTGRRSATVVIQGPAGIGKTALVQTWLQSRRGSGDFVLYAEADDYASGPLAPIRWALDSTDSAVATKERERCLEAMRPSTTVGTPPDDSMSMLVADFLRAASDGTAIVVIEDAHIADEDTLRLCTELGRFVDIPIMLILTYRTTQGHASMGFASYLSRQIDVGLAHRIALRPLSAAGANELITELVERELQPPQLRELTEIADGNPLFLVLAARLCQDYGESGSPVRWPRAARDELLHRFVPIDSRAADLASQLAEFGRFTWNDFRRLCSVTALEGDKVREALDELLIQGVLRRTVTGVEFTHPLIKQAFASLLGRERRADFHLHLARILFDSGNAESLFEAATHLKAAGANRGDDQLEALLNAANSAMWVSPGPAASWFERIRNSPAATRKLRAQATAGQITALVYSGRTASALELCLATMAALPPQYRDTELIEVTATAALPTRELTLLIGLLDGDSPRASITTRSCIATAHILLGEVDVGRPLYRDCLRELTENPAGSPPVPFSLLFGCAAILGEVDDVRLLHKLTLQKATIATPVERQLLTSCVEMQELHLPADLFAPALKPLDRPTRLSTAGTQELTAAFRYFIAGEWDNLLEYVPAQLELLRSTGNVLASTGPIGCATAVLIEREQWSAAASMVAQEDWPHDTAWGTLIQLSLARLEVSRGHIDAAIERLSTLEHTLRTKGLIPAYSMVADLLCSLLLDGGDRDCAQRIALGSRTHIGGLNIPIQDAYTLLAVARATDDAAAARAALASAHVIPMPFVAARCEVQLAYLGDSPSERLRRAHQTFKKLGAVTERARAEQAMRDLGVTTPRGRAYVDRLTAVESTIVRAVLQGHTNRRIARDLHYSPKTIEMHLSRIYARTNRSGRVDLVKAVTAGEVALTDR